MDVEKYKLKLLGYWTTDSKTPVIREFLTVVAKLYEVDLRCYETIVEFDSDGVPVLTAEMADLLANDRDMFYRVAAGPYEVDDEDIPMMLRAIAPQVNYEFASELEEWLTGLAAAETWEQIDEFQLPGMDYEPDDEPEGIIRVAGPVANLLAVTLSGRDSRSKRCALNAPAAIDDPMADCSLDELAAAAEVALEQYLREREAGDIAPPHASACGGAAAPSQHVFLMR
jgi:hypothetical protein